MSDDITKALSEWIKELLARRHFYDLALLLYSDAVHAEENAKASLLEELKEKNNELYYQIIRDLFIAIGGFIFQSACYQRLWHYIDTPFILDMIEKDISQTENNCQLLDLYQHFYTFSILTNFYYTYKTGQIDISSDQIQGQLPDYLCNRAGSAERLNDLFKKPLADFATIALPGGLPKNPQIHVLDIDDVRKRRTFLLSHNRQTLTLYENIILREKFPDRFFEAEKNLLSWVDVARNGIVKTELIIPFQIQIAEEHMKLLDFEMAEHIMNIMIEHFPNDTRVQDMYLRIKTELSHIEDAMVFLTNKYETEEIEENPRLLMFKSDIEYHLGNVSKAFELSKKAYKNSGQHPAFFNKYVQYQIMSNSEEAKKTLRETMRENELSPSQVLSFANMFSFLEIENKGTFLEELLYHFSIRHLDKQASLEESMDYFDILFRTNIRNRNYSHVHKTLEEMQQRFPEWEGTYRRLLEFYSDIENKEFFDITLALEHAKMCGEIREIPPGYYEGLVYGKSKNYNKAIDEYEKFKREIGIPIPVQYMRIFQHLYYLYMGLEEKGKACENASQYIEMYDTTRNKFLYNNSIAVDISSIVVGDLVFFKEVYDTCPRLRRRAKELLDKYSNWCQSANLHHEIEQLTIDIEHLEEELRKLKEKSRTISLNDEKSVQKTVDKIMENASSKSMLLKKIHHTEWKEAEDVVVSLGLKDIVDELYCFVVTSEYLFLVNEDKADYSSVILGYAKAFEFILDLEISQPFRQRNIQSAKGKHKEIEENAISGILKNKHKTITIGQWNRLLRRASQPNLQEKIHPLSIEFFEVVRMKMDNDIEKVKKTCNQLQNMRNDCVHKEKISKERAQKCLPILRSSLKELLTILQGTRIKHD